VPSIHSAKYNAQCQQADYDICDLKTDSVNTILQRIVNVLLKIQLKISY